VSYRETAKELIQHGEDCVLHAYKDSLGYLTIGWGRMIDPERGGGISRAEADFLLQNDLAQDETTAKAFFPNFDSLSDNRKAVLMDMAHNLRNGLHAFKGMRAAIAAGDFHKAADEMMDSLWAKQVKSRADRLAQMMRDG
jgi:lysozyme